MSKFKEGDKVRVINKNKPSPDYILPDTTIGEIVELTKVSSSGLWWDIKNGSSYRFVYTDNIELVKDTPKPKFKIGDKVRVLRNDHRGHKVGYIGVITDSNTTIDNHKAWIIDNSWYNAEDELELVEECCNSCEVEDKFDAFDAQTTINQINSYCGIFNEPSNSSGNKVGKIMSKLGNFVKNSLLSADEKLLRKNGLKDSCGDYTIEAQELVIAKLIKDNEAYLIEVATAMEAEENKNK